LLSREEGKGKFLSRGGGEEKKGKVINNTRERERIPSGSGWGKERKKGDGNRGTKKGKKGSAKPFWRGKERALRRKGKKVKKKEKVLAFDGGRKKKGESTPTLTSKAEGRGKKGKEC